MEIDFNKDIPDMVNHPAHYVEQSADGYEPIELTEIFPNNIGTALKYIVRAGHKDDIVRDLRKARWYLLRALELYYFPIANIDTKYGNDPELIREAFRRANPLVAPLFSDDDKDCIHIYERHVALTIRAVDEKIDKIVDDRQKSLAILLNAAVNDHDDEDDEGE